MIINKVKLEKVDFQPSDSLFSFYEVTKNKTGFIKEASVELKESNIVLQAGKLEIIKACSNGDIYVKGKLVKNDIEVVDALKEFLSKSK